MPISSKFGALKPFLLLLIPYTLIVVLGAPESLTGDEPRYVSYAERFFTGYYISNDDPNLGAGLGYPLVLAPFVGLGIPLMVPRLLNVLFAFFAIVFVYKSLRLYIPERTAKILSWIMGLYPPLLFYMRFLLTDTWSFYLIAGFMYFALQFLRKRERTRHNMVWAAVHLGLLTLAKVIFGYAIVVMLLICGLLVLWKKVEPARRLAWIGIGGLVLCLPYLSYTFVKSGKVFYWGNSGGEQLYWMSSPYPDEYGSWFTSAKLHESPEAEANHKEFLDYVDALPYKERHEQMQKKAIENIKNHPDKYIRNWMANVGRLLFHYPYSHRKQVLADYFFIVPNMFIVVVFLLSLYPGWLARFHIPKEILLTSLLPLIYLGGSTIPFATTRYFTLVIPALLLWMAYIYVNVVDIQFVQSINRDEA